MNKTLFKTKTPVIKSPVVDNAAGGKSYSLGSKLALAQYAVNGTLNDTFYASADNQLENLIDLLKTNEDEFIAKVAVYAAENGKMKDMPVVMLAYLFSTDTNPELVEKTFNRVITNSKKLCNFVQCIRSNTFGRKSFGTLGKRLINQWLTSRSAVQLFKDSVGRANPSLVDVVKMTHPKFNDEQNNMIKYLLKKEFDYAGLPDLVQKFERLKSGSEDSPEGLDFRLLSNISLSTNQWTNLAKGMTWEALRMNLNNLEKHGVFSNPEIVSAVADKLSNRELVKRNNVFPYQLLTTYQNTKTLPNKISQGLEAALEIATENVPNLGKVAVCVDVSGSMSSAITGNGRVSSVTRCVDVAALIASCILRASTDCKVVPFDTEVRSLPVSKENSVVKNSQILSVNGGGTSCSSPIRYLDKTGWNGDVIVMVSDNMSWTDYASNSGISNYWGAPPIAGTTMKEAWNNIRGRNGKCKLILIDITPNRNSQMHEDKNVLHIGGFSDDVFNVIKTFLSDRDTFVDVIEGITL